MVGAGAHVVTYLEQTSRVARIAPTYDKHEVACGCKSARRLLAFVRRAAYGIENANLASAKEQGVNYLAKIFTGLRSLYDNPYTRGNIKEFNLMGGTDNASLAIGAAKNSFDFGMTCLAHDDNLVTTPIKRSRMVLHAFDKGARGVDNVQSCVFGGLLELRRNSVRADNQGAIFNFVNRVGNICTLLLKILDNAWIVNQFTESVN